MICSYAVSYLHDLSMVLYVATCIHNTSPTRFPCMGWGKVGGGGRDGTDGHIPILCPIL